jgi:membrane-associated phospholipid phosphatase
VDLALLRLLRTRGHWPLLERFAKVYARAGENGALWLVLAALLRNRRTVRVVLVALIANPPLAATISGRSYPSAHAATSFAAAGALPLPSLPLYAAAGAMALTRPYLGVHYPSDVVAGALLGRALERLL